MNRRKARLLHSKLIVRVVWFIRTALITLVSFWVASREPGRAPAEALWKHLSLKRAIRRNLQSKRFRAWKARFRLIWERVENWVTSNDGFDGLTGRALRKHLDRKRLDQVEKFWNFKNLETLGKQYTSSKSDKFWRRNFFKWNTQREWIKRWAQVTLPNGALSDEQN